MVAGKTALCNLSLDKIGAGNISDYNSKTEPHAAECRKHLPNCTDEFLNKYDWSFALERVVLAEDGGDNLTPYQYKMMLPGDILRPIALLDPQDGHDSQMPYWIEGNFLYTDYSPSGLLYVKRVYEPGKWNQGFLNGVVLLLAARITNKIGKKELKAESLEANAFAAMWEGIALDRVLSRERWPGPDRWDRNT